MTDTTLRTEDTELTDAELAGVVGGLSTGIPGYGPIYRTWPAEPVPSPGPVHTPPPIVRIP